MKAMCAMAMMASSAGCATLASEPPTGSTSQAMISSVSTGLQDPASCRFFDSVNQQEYAALFGGTVLGMSPSTTNAVSLAPDDTSGGSGAWATQTATLTTARHGAKAYQLDATHCALVGGFTGTGESNPSSAVDVFVLNSGSPATLSRQTGTANLQNARGLLQLKLCKETGGTKHLVAMFGTSRTDVEVSDDVTAGTWGNWTATSLLSSSLADFGADEDVTSAGTNQYMVGGGTSGGAASNKLYTMTLSASCASPTLTEAHDNANHANVVTLSQSVEGNALFYEGTSSTFVATAGRLNNTTLAATTFSDKIVVNDWSHGYVTRTANYAALNTAAYRPVVTESATNHSKHTLTTGANAAVSSALDKVQTYTSGSPGSFALSCTLNTAVYQPGVAFLSTAGKVNVATGASTPNTTTTTTNTQCSP
jgi:hypothetical protein